VKTAKLEDVTLKFMRISKKEEIGPLLEKIGITLNNKNKDEDVNARDDFKIRARYLSEKYDWVGSIN
jgi:hypothetical protein